MKSRVELDRRTVLVRVLILALVLYVAIVAIVSLRFDGGAGALREGTVSQATIKSPYRVTFVSQSRTREARLAAAAAIPDQYVVDERIAEEARERLTTRLLDISDARARGGSPEVPVVETQRMLDPAAADLAVDIVAMTSGEWLTVAAESQRVFDVVARGRISAAQFESTLAIVPGLVSPTLPERHARLVSAIVRAHLRPNYVLDAVATEQARRDAQDRVEPVRVTLERGETIIRDGTVVRTLDIEKLDAVGLRRDGVAWRDIASSGLLLFPPVAGLAIYVYRLRGSLLGRPRRAVALVVLIVATVLVVRLVLPERETMAYILPIGAPILLVSILLGFDLALIVGALLAIVVAALTGTSSEFLIVSLAGASAAALTGSRVERLNGFIAAGATIALMTFAASAAFAIAAGESDPAYLVRLAGFAVANGSLAAIIAVGTLTVVGYLFGLTTTLGLNDLAHPTQPLFRRLLTEAPGTYHHSIMVANLAERAAEAIGADTLLCRVGSYYHDIGKLTRPYAFIENQMGAENIHDRLDPLTSARMIGAHVTDGIALARAHRLPDGIRDLIAQHHGTAFIGAFYVKARQEGLGPVDPADFRYVGPKPQTKEAAILMLADSVEAAARASASHAPEVIEEIVGKIFNGRLEQGELDECDLTRRDLSQIRATFLTILNGVYHPRVAYPEPERMPAPASNAPGA